MPQNIYPDPELACTMIDPSSEQPLANLGTKSLLFEKKKRGDVFEINADILTNILQGRNIKRMISKSRGKVFE